MAASCLAPILALGCGSALAVTLPAPTLTAPATSTGTYVVSWTGIAGSAEDRYTLQESGNGGLTWATVINRGTVLSREFTKTTTGPRSYRVQYCLVVGSNAQCSAFSPVKVVSVYIQPTGTPGIGCSGCGNPDADAAVTIQWTRPQGTITHYRVFNRRNGGAWQHVTVAGADTLSKQFTNLADGNWDFQVDACNVLVDSTCSTDDSAIKSVEVERTPTIPTGVSLPSANTTGQFTLAWSASTGTSVSYEVWRRKSTETQFQKVATRTTTSYTPTNHPDGLYAYKVKACNSTCSGFSVERTIDVLKVPTQPANVSVPASSNNGVVSITWAAAHETIAHYEVTRAARPATVCPTADSAYARQAQVGSLSHTISAHPDGAFCYRVQACNPSGCSAATAPQAVVVEKTLEGLPDDELPEEEAPASEPIGTLKEAPSLEGGRVGYTITIPVPPGRLGMAPQVSLEYGSGNGEGVVGMGWSLSAGQGSVYRCPSLEAIEGETRPYRGVQADRLCLDGQPLMLVSGSYGADNSVYRPETNPFLTVKLRGGNSLSSSSYFEVTDKSGTVRTYKEQVIPPRSDNAAGYPTHWLLTLVKDLGGNRIDYQYSGGDEERLLSKIVYTGFGSGLGNRTVNFNYEARPQTVTSFNGQGFMRLTSKLLGSITSTVNGQPVQHVKLRYEGSVLSGRPLLKGARLCADTQCIIGYPESVYTYSEQAQAFSNQTLVTSQSDEFKDLAPVGDIDGDGQQDYVLFVMEVPVGDMEAVELRVSSRTSPISLAHWRSSGDLLTSSDFLGHREIQYADFNSDGRADLVGVRSNGVVDIGIWNLQEQRVDALPTNLTVPSAWRPYRLRDFDRDGDTDIVSLDGVLYVNCSGERTVQINFCRQYELPEGHPGAQGVSYDVYDFNADGLPDVLYSAQDQDDRVRFGQLSNGQYVLGPVQDLDALGGPNAISILNHHGRLMDVNGDGLQDIFQQRYSFPPNGTVVTESRLWINTGGRFEARTLNGAIGLNRHLANGVIVMDYNQDGQDDLLVPAQVAPGGTYCYTFFPNQPGGPPSDGPGEDLRICSGSGVAQFEGGHYPHLNRGIYQFDQVRFVEQANGSISLQRSATSLSGVIHNSQPCDANNDGAPDLCYQIAYGFAPLHAQNCDMAVDALGCAWTSGAYPSNPQLGSHARINERGNAFGFDLLVSATNGLGMKQLWDYAALSSQGYASCQYTAQRPFYRVDPDAAMPGHYHFNASMTVVSRRRSSNGVGGFNAECIRYEDAMYSTEGRGFQGFKAISRDEMLGDGRDKTVRTEYYDYFPLTGRPFREQTWLRSDNQAQANPLNETIQNWAWDERSDNTWFVYLDDQIDLVYNFDAPGRPTQSRRELDYGYSDSDLARGNVSSQLTTLSTFDASGALLVSDRNTVVFDYDYSQPDWLNRLESKTVTYQPTTYGSGLNGPVPNEASNNREVVTETYTYHGDGTRRLHTKTLQPGTPDQKLVETYGYDQYGNVDELTLSAVNQAPRTTHVFFDGSDGYFPSRRVVGGFSTHLVHNPATGALEDQFNPEGTEVHNDYDFAGQLISVRTNTGPKAVTATTRCSSSDCGRAIVKTVVRQAGSPTSTTYTDLLGRVVKQVTEGLIGQDAVVTTTSFDARGNKLSESQPANAADSHLTQYLDYDALGRYGRKIVDRSGHAVASQVWQYDHQGPTTVITLPDGELTASRVYDAANRLLATTDAMGSTTHHRYDGQGNKILTQNHAGTQIRSYFDALDRKVRVEDPDAGRPDAASETVVYNGYGEKVQVTNANGITVSTQHDTMGRPTLRAINGVTDAIWIYDENGKPQMTREETGHSDSDGVPDSRKVFHYDDRGRLIKTVQTIDGVDGVVRTFVDEVAYDANYGRIKGRKYASGEMVRYRYSAAGRLIKETEPYSADGTEREYYEVIAESPRGQLEEIAYGNGVSGSTLHYDSTGDVEGILYDKAGVALANLRYEYTDAFGNLTRRENVTSGAAETFTYDALQRLDGSSIVWDDASIAPQAVDYQYDAVGNLVRKDDFGLVYHYGNVARSAGGNAGPHAVRRVDLTNGGTLSDFQYDDAGNMTAGNGRSTQYNVFNKPVRITQGVKVSQFRYGPDLGLVVRQEGGETTYYGADYQLVVAAGGVQAERTFIGKHVVVERRGSNRKVRYQHHDRLGSLVLVTDENGVATETHGFDAFGQPLKGDWQNNGGLLHAGTGAEQLTEKGYTGHEHLDDHKLVHMGGRVYDPILGRFMSVDPFIQNPGSTQTQNPYSYVMNNPLSLIDPSGYRMCDVGRGGSNCSEIDPLSQRNQSQWAGLATGRVQQGNGKAAVDEQQSTQHIEKSGESTTGSARGAWKPVPVARKTKPEKPEDENSSQTEYGTYRAIHVGQQISISTIEEPASESGEFEEAVEIWKELRSEHGAIGEMFRGAERSSMVDGYWLSISVDDKPIGDDKASVRPVEGAKGWMVIQFHPSEGHGALIRRMAIYTQIAKGYSVDDISMGSAKIIEDYWRESKGMDPISPHTYNDYKSALSRVVQVK